jgi:AcrR family transcriptional regulator
MEAAAQAFLTGGYRGTSMDEIAAAAGVSKQTVYKQFVDKQRLFVEIVTGTVAVAGDLVHDEVRALHRQATTWPPTCVRWPAASSSWSCARRCCGCAAW